ncbi:unnamed protein product [Rotaria sordida]|uniref:Uncharacterized protein n=1 Tax=Rotaria sordida TaxID=392033 RepID=A0A813TD60_9BILA|nr:unnamed protein product [Rotaria sordida]
MILNKIIFLTLVLLLNLTNADHFRGGIISWRPLSTQPNGSTVKVQVHQRYFWNRNWSSFTRLCTESDVINKTTIPVNNWAICYINCSSSTFPSGGISTVMTSTDCDTNALVRSWAGERYDTLTLPLTTSITIGYSSSAWFGPNLYPAAGGTWALVNRINLALRPDGYINSSPVTNTLPVLFKPVGQQLVHVIQMADNDGTDILKCRWSNSNAATNYNRKDECEDACMGLNGISTLYEENYVTITERVIAQSFCAGATITNYVTSSPIGMQHSAVVSQGGGLYVMTLTWTPEDKQYGPQGFCAGAVDTNNLQSDAWCVTYLVGFDSPDLIRTQTVQGTASPIGTIFSNHSIFSIQATREVHRPTRNGTYIKFMDASTNTSVQVFDAGWQPNILYYGNTISIITSYSWIPGRSYYVLFDSGVASGIEFCGPESAPITSPTFWTFNIWDPGLSSTTTTTTTPPTTGTVTTRPISTTTVNTLLTTTGVHVTTANPITTTITDTTTSTTSTSTATTATTSTSTPFIPEISIIDPKAFEEACKQPVALMTVATFAGMIPLHAMGIFAMFTKLNKMFNQNHISSIVRHQRRLGKIR